MPYLAGALTMAALPAVKLHHDGRLARAAATRTDARRGHAGAGLDREHRRVEVLTAAVLVLALAMSVTPVPAG